jgi:hypothetical protein
MDGIESILFGASSRTNIQNSKELIQSFSARKIEKVAV